MALKDSFAMWRAGHRKQDILNIVNIDAFAVPSPFNVTWFYSANSFLQQTSALLWGSYGSYKTQRQPSPLVITKTRFFLVHRHTESNTHKKGTKRNLLGQGSQNVYRNSQFYCIYYLFQKVKVQEYSDVAFRGKVLFYLKHPTECQGAQILV